MVNSDWFSTSHKMFDPLDPLAIESLFTGWSLTLDQQPLLTDEILPATKIGRTTAYKYNNKHRLTKI